nr:MAG TPA: hypothetical protein [Bacteriophage sp.]
MSQEHLKYYHIVIITQKQKNSLKPVSLCHIMYSL